jgi:hypothetical protein
MQAALRDHVGEHAFAEWDALPDDEKLAALLNDHNQVRQRSDRSGLNCTTLLVRHSAGKGGPPSDLPLHTSIPPA